ncbi:type I-E CRISPR-associated protein Cas6/Cse3/CasE [Mangrovactinospora gilvigrisea]|uniref:Type I-E CRISPR-associated protein Cas6/Cse3/CasE n=1 Tax=Mangrovactinospora gilvigrisea TaxID=1428644 RepID=A0A1J7CHQ4_9ACTN|nr:type I-E CRISPR-associated protein Cas6/Cse3/CasE [Mangrovactinospora gilvigrisea]OIV39170.1 type I-E CRISPR-associated protein Cas6/Cse3/CasE [Mangrovactinospora gilvigrisea]
MYLTRFRINTGRNEARRLLSSPQRLHGAVNMAFPDLPTRDGTGPRVLWRLDAAPGGRTDLLISSPQRPDLTHLAEQAGWPSLGQQGWTTFAYGEFLDSLANNDVWAFRLTANPVHHIRRDEDPVGAPTKRAAHVTVRHQVGWLLKQQERGGFTILPRELGSPTGPPASYEGRPPTKAGGSATEAKSPAATAAIGDDEPRDWEYQLIVHDRTPVRFGRRPGSAPAKATARSRPDVQFARATFDGLLRITDLTAFHRTLTHGLGKAKAYGCGLMTLAPAPVKS